MNYNKLENMLAFHCGPALAGIKPSNMISCFKKSMPDIHAQIERLNNMLNSKNIYLEIMCECDRRIFLMAYRKDVLDTQLQKPEIRAFLADYGYAEEASLESYIEHLKLRLKDDCFPHEIGAFLGYPLHDILGFIEHKGDNCLCVGDWKVYDKEEEAKQLFERYKACRQGITRRLEAGCTLAQVFGAA